ncbi:MAG: endolytic transglycosylase MltG [Clostridia bacterium]|nr:endolytic transglycosylase MltG [Clostridia bacterium]
MTKTERKKKTKMFRTAVIVLLIALAIFIWKVVPVLNEYFSDEPYNGKTVSIIVQQGDNINIIAERLEKKGVIDNKTGFIYKYKMNVEDYGPIQYFEEPVYIEKGMTNHDILKMLTTIKPVSMVKVVIPEGFSVDMIALRMSNHGLCSVDEFIEAVNDAEQYDYEFIKYIPDGNYKYKLEGFLFPNTYIFEEGITAREIVNEMLKTFEEEYELSVNSYENIFEIITIASMVEREAKISEERPTISGVIRNRLDIDMLLQIDATAVYAKSDGLYDIENVNAETVAVESPYNTYKYIGLPPGPICNPGISAVKAAANPESHSYLYYHTDTSKNDGSHIFTETYEQHVGTMQ